MNFTYTHEYAYSMGKAKEMRDNSMADMKEK